MRYVKVKFLSTKDSATADNWYYKDTQSRKLQKYDTVVVPTRYGLSMAVVTGTFSDFDSVFNDGYNSHITESSIKTVLEKIKSKSVDAEMKLAKVDDIKKQLQEKMKQVDEVQKYKMYAEIDPTIASLLEELESMKA